MADKITKWLGGSPLAVFGWLVLLSVLLGVVLAASGFDPLDIIWNIGFDALRWLWRYFLLGAVFVIPIWLIARLLKAPRPSFSDWTKVEDVTLAVPLASHIGGSAAPITTVTPNMTSDTAGAATLNADVRQKQRRCRNNGAVVGLIGGVIGMLIDGLPVTDTAAPLVFWSIWGAFALVAVLLCVLVGGAVGWYVGKTKHPVAYFLLINIAINMVTAPFAKEIIKERNRAIAKEIIKQKRSQTAPTTWPGTEMKRETDCSKERGAPWCDYAPTPRPVTDPETLKQQARLPTCKDDERRCIHPSLKPNRSNEAFTAMAYFPPPEYDHPYPGQMLVRYVTAETARKHCPSHGIACVIGYDEELCVIVFNTAWFGHHDQIMRHERGHCNGWPAHHPNTR